MSDSMDPSSPPATPEQMKSAMFASLILQQSNMAMMFLGKTPHPESGKTLQDTNAARMFIDMLEMIEEKTKGNLNSDESAMLKDTLTGLRMAFVEVINKHKEPQQPPPPASASTPAESGQ